MGGLTERPVGRRGVTPVPVIFGSGTWFTGVVYILAGVPAICAFLLRR